jgi:predicted heme/steroid binding protein
MFATVSSEASTSQLREPVLIALLVCLVFYAITKYFQTAGCPFAKPLSKTTKHSSMVSSAPAGSLRLTMAELAQYDGQDTSKPLYISVRGKIYDVTAGKTFYGPGGQLEIAGQQQSSVVALSSRQYAAHKQQLLFILHKQQQKPEL